MTLCDYLFRDITLLEKIWLYVSGKFFKSGGFASF